MKPYSNVLHISFQGSFMRFQRSGYLFKPESFLRSETAVLLSASNFHHSSSNRIPVSLWTTLLCFSIHSSFSEPSLGLLCLRVSLSILPVAFDSRLLSFWIAKSYLISFIELSEDQCSRVPKSAFFLVPQRPTPVLRSHLYPLGIIISDLIIVIETIRSYFQDSSSLSLADIACSVPRITTPTANTHIS